MSEKKLSGKTALVTGGSRGIGAAIAKRLGDEGASVAITYTSSPEKAQEVVRAIEAGGGRAVAVQADAADESAVRAAVQKTVSHFGRLDILVNNAGIAEIGAIDAMDMKAFDKMLAINVRGLFVATQEAVRHMGQGGRIINIGSVNSERVPFTGGSAYALTKGAVAAFTRGLARDLGPRGITVNNIQPGPINTDMNPEDSDWGRATLPSLAIPRYGRVEEIASLAAYLAGPEAAYITGAGLLADGGYAA